MAVEIQLDILSKLIVLTQADLTLRTSNPPKCPFRLMVKNNEYTHLWSTISTRQVASIDSQCLINNEAEVRQFLLQEEDLVEEEVEDQLSAYKILVNNSSTLNLHLQQIAKTA